MMLPQKFKLAIITDELTDFFFNQQKKFICTTFFWQFRFFTKYDRTEESLFFIDRLSKLLITLFCIFFSVILIIFISV